MIKVFIEICNNLRKANLLEAVNIIGTDKDTIENMMMYIQGEIAFRAVLDQIQKPKGEKETEVK